MRTQTVRMTTRMVIEHQINRQINKQILINRSKKVYFGNMIFWLFVNTVRDDKREERKNRIN